MKHPFLAAIALLAIASTAIPAVAADRAESLYTRALGLERTVRNEANHATLAQIRRVVGSYEQIVRRYPASGYCDNALWQAANLSLLAFDRFGEQADQKTATRLLRLLTTGYPASKLVAGATSTLEQIDRPSPTTGQATSSPAVEGTPSSSDSVGTSPVKLTRSTRAEAPVTQTVQLKAIQRSLLPDGVRVTLDLDAEVPYHKEELDGPRRVFFDLKGARPVASLQDVTLKYDDDVVKEIRLGRHPQNTTRVVLDMDGVSAYSVYALYNPYRLVIDFRRAAASSHPVTAPPLVPSLPAPLPPAPKNDPPRSVAERVTKPEIQPEKPLLDAKPAAPAMPPPAAPAANSNGKFSISRQLGLGVSRIVIDAGHGGHDPGAQGKDISEAELTLDVAQRLEKLLEKEPGVEVVMTRDSDVFIPLQERTAIANREGADLFLSIHANASRNPSARGIETYFLNFASNPEAEAVAARENAGSGQAMHSLPDIVKAIALNNKINESRDFAETVQKSMVKRLSVRNKQLRDLGVKQAPFVVLIGAGMPSVLAEISFITHRQEGALLKSGPYRQQIAQALLEAIVNYQQALKRMNAVAMKKATY